MSGIVFTDIFSSIIEEAFTDETKEGGWFYTYTAYGYSSAEQTFKKVPVVGKEFLKDS